MKKIIYALYLISLSSFGLKLDSRSHLTPGVTNTILLVYKFFLQKGIYVIVVLTNGFLFFVFYFLIKNRLDLRKIVFFSLMVLNFALMKLSSQIVVVSVGQVVKDHASKPNLTCNAKAYHPDRSFELLNAWKTRGIIYEHFFF